MLKKVICCSGRWMLNLIFKKLFNSVSGTVLWCMLWPEVTECFCITLHVTLHLLFISIGTRQAISPARDKTETERIRSPLLPGCLLAGVPTPHRSTGSCSPAVNSQSIEAIIRTRLYDCSRKRRQWLSALFAIRLFDCARNGLLLL